jgi:hypothetical protein
VYAKPVLTMPHHASHCQVAGITPILISVAPNGSNITRAGAFASAAALASTIADDGIGPTQSRQPDSMEVQLTIDQLVLAIVAAFARIRSATDQA